MATKEYDDLTPMQLRMYADGAEKGCGVGWYFDKAFYDVFREHWNVCSDTMGDLFATYLDLGHAKFMKRMERYIEHFEYQCDAVAILELTNTYENLDTTGETHCRNQIGFLESKIAMFKKRLALGTVQNPTSMEAELKECEAKLADYRSVLPDSTSAAAESEASR